jgi:hypothetical protein
MRAMANESAGSARIRPLPDRLWASIAEFRDTMYFLRLVR